MPISRFISDLDKLIEEFQSDDRSSSAAFDELRMAVARMNEINRQHTIAQEKLASVLSLAEMKARYHQITYTGVEPDDNDRFLFEECQIGIPEIDDSHQRMFASGNRLYRISNKRDISPVEVIAALDDLVSQARSSFDIEEQMMHRCIYQDMDNHKDHHGRMLDYLVEMYAMASTQPLVVAIKLEKFLGSWFIWHVQREDADFAEHYKAVVSG
jgi:hemerythrin-like metal-binding protein